MKENSPKKVSSDSVVNLISSTLKSEESRRAAEMENTEESSKFIKYHIANPEMFIQTKI